MHTKYGVSMSYGSKVIGKFKVDKQTDRTKTICTPSFDQGHKNTFVVKIFHLIQCRIIIFVKMS